MKLPPLPSDSSRLVVFKNTISQLLGKSISSFATLLVSIILARAFGPEGYGDYIKIITYIGLFFLFADFGLNAIYLERSHALSDETQKQNLWRSLSVTRLIGSCILLFVALAILSFLPHGTTQGYTSSVRLGIILFAPAILFQALISNANALFQEYLRYDLATIAVIAGSLITLLLTWLVAMGASPLVGPVFAAVSLLIGTLVTALVSLALVKRFSILNLSFDKTLMRSLLVGSIPLGVTLILNQIYFRADSFILTLTRSTQDVGFYGFAYKIFEVPLVVPTFFMNAVYPLLLKKREREEDFRNFVVTSFWVLVAGSIVVLVGIWICAPILLLVRPEFEGSVSALRILSLGIPFFFVSSLTMWTLIALGKSRLLPFIYGGATILNIVANILTIPRFGYIGAAWVTVVSEGLVLVVCGILVLQSLPRHETYYPHRWGSERQSGAGCGGGGDRRSDK